MLAAIARRGPPKPTPKKVAVLELQPIENIPEDATSEHVLDMLMLDGCVFSEGCFAGYTMRG